MMTRQLWLWALAIGLFSLATTPSNAHAQSLTIGRGGIQYNGYGRGYYGGYGPTYSRRVYSGYGNGPYGYGSGSAYVYPSNGGYVNGNGTYYNGYGNSGYVAPVYNPYGFGTYNTYGGWW